MKEHVTFIRKNLLTRWIFAMHCWFCLKQFMNNSGTYYVLKKLIEKKSNYTNEIFTTFSNNTVVFWMIFSQLSETTLTFFRISENFSNSSHARCQQIVPNGIMKLQLDWQTKVVLTLLRWNSFYKPIWKPSDDILKLETFTLAMNTE